MLMSTALEIVRAGMGAFSPSERLKKQARGASAAAWGSIALLGVSAWLSQPIYFQYAARQGAAAAGDMAWVVAGFVAVVVFAFGADIARNVAAMMKGYPTDPAGTIALTIAVWLGFAGLDVMVQYYGSEFRAREASGEVVADISTVATDPYPAQIAAAQAELAEVDFRRSWCGKHKTRHGNSYTAAMTADPSGAWTFTCSDQVASFGSAFEQERQGIRNRIGELRRLQTDHHSQASSALADRNAGVFSVREATERTYKYLTFALYIICLGLSVKVSIYLIDWEEENQPEKAAARRMEEVRAKEMSARAERNLRRLALAELPDPDPVAPDPDPVAQEKPARRRRGLLGYVLGDRHRDRQQPPQEEEEVAAPLPEPSPAKGKQETAYRQNSIGFRTGNQNRKDTTGSLPENPASLPPPPVENQASTTRQAPPKKHTRRVEANEARLKIKTAYRTLAESGQKPTYPVLAKITRLSIRTIGTHVREMKEEGML